MDASRMMHPGNRRPFLPLGPSHSIDSLISHRFLSTDIDEFLRVCERELLPDFVHHLLLLLLGLRPRQAATSARTTEQ